MWAQPEYRLQQMLQAIGFLISLDNTANRAERFFALGGIQAVCDCLLKHDRQGFNIPLQASCLKADVCISSCFRRF